MKLNSDASAFHRVQRYDAPDRIEGLERVELRRFNDDGGSMIELMRPNTDGPDELTGFDLAQINYSTLQPGTIKAFHVHRRQTDVWFVPPEDRVLLVVVDVRDGRPQRVVRMMLGDGRSQLVRIPPGVAHGCKNLGQTVARLFYFTDLEFSPDPSECDEGRLPWDFVGDEVWRVARE